MGAMALKSAGLGTALLLTSLLSVSCSGSADSALKAGDELIGQQKYREAVIEYRKAIQKDPRLGVARLRLAQTYMRLNDPPNALEQFVRAADLMPEDVTAQLSAGNILLAAGRFEESKARARAVLGRDVKNIDAQLLLGSASAGLKDVGTAIKQVEEAIAIDPSKAGSYAKLGALQLQRGDFIDAEKAFKSALFFAPKSAKANLSLGNFYLATGRLPDAEQYLKEAVAIEPGNALANRALVALYIGTQRYKDAEGPVKALAAAAPDAQGQVFLGRYYAALGRLPEATAVFEKIKDVPEFRSTASVELAKIDVLNAHPDQARTKIAAVLAKDPNYVPALLLKSSLLVADGKSDEAFAEATKAVAADPKSAVAQYFVGVLSQSRQNYDEATAAFTQVLALNPRAAAAQLRLSEVSLASGRAAAAVQFGADAVKNAPGSVDARLALARGLMANGQLDKAEAELKGLTTRYPKQAVPIERLGEVYALKKNAGEARRAFTRALELDPVNVDAIGGLVLTDLEAQHAAEARARVEAALVKQPKSSSLYVLAGTVYAAGHDDAKAEAAWRKALDLAPDNLQVYTRLGQLYVAQNRPDAAIAEYEALVSKMPKSVGANTMVAMLLEAKGRTKEAQQRYERIVQFDPKAAVASNNLAWIYAEGGGSLDVALQLAQAAVGQAGDQPEFLDTLGWVYCKKKLASMAVQPLEAAVQKDPKRPDYRYHLGVAYAGSGKKQKARTAFDDALRLKPDFPEAAQAKRDLDKS